MPKESSAHHIIYSLNLIEWNEDGSLSLEKGANAGVITFLATCSKEILAEVLKAQLSETQALAVLGYLVTALTTQSETALVSVQPPTQTPQFEEHSQYVENGVQPFFLVDQLRAELRSDRWSYSGETTVVRTNKIHTTFFVSPAQPTTSVRELNKAADILIKGRKDIYFPARMHQDGNLEIPRINFQEKLGKVYEKQILQYSFEIPNPFPEQSQVLAQLDNGEVTEEEETYDLKRYIDIYVLPTREVAETMKMITDVRIEDEKGLGFMEKGKQDYSKEYIYLCHGGQITPELLKEIRRKLRQNKK